MKKGTLLPTLTATITALAVWLVIDYIREGGILLQQSIFKAVLFALVFGITFGFLSSSKK